MKLIASTLFLMTALSSVAQADIIKCSFTEPFIITTYSMAQQTLKSEVAGEKATIAKNVSFQIVGPGEFVLVAKDGSILQKLSLTNKGSDGMSDFDYPFEVTMGDKARKLHGGCSSNYLKATNPYK